MSVDGTFPRFPPEIIDSFVGNLLIDGTFNSKAAKDPLLACSLVSRSFSTAARRRIFSTIAIKGYRPRKGGQRHRLKKRSKDELSKRIKALAELITPDTSDLALLIRKLDLVFDSRQMALNNKCNLNVLLRLLISRSSNLNTLALRVQMPWNDISPEIVQSLTEIAQSPALVNLDLHYLTDVPREAITNNLTLRSIGLSNVTFSIPTSPYDEALALNPLDTYLPSTGRYKFVDDHSTRNISKVTSFEMDLSNEEDAKTLGQVVKAAPPSLVSFELTTHAGYLGFRLGGTVNLGCVPRLRKIVLRFQTYSQGLSCPNARDVISFFNDGTPTMLEEIEIIFHLTGGPHVPQIEGLIPKEDKGLESLGCSFLNNKHPRLKITTIGISLLVPRVRTSIPPGLRAIEKNLQARMTSLINNSNAITANVRINVVAKFCED